MNIENSFSLVCQVVINLKMHIFKQLGYLALSVCFSGNLVGLVVSKSHACYLLCWEVLVRTGFESRWGRISVALLVAYLAMLSL